MAYTRALETADRLIARYGQDAALIRLTGTPPVNPWDDPSQIEETLLVKFIETGLTEDLQGSTLIQAGDVVGLIESGFQPRLTDKFMLRGVIYSLIDVQPMQPGGPLLATRIVARA